MEALFEIWLDGYKLNGRPKSTYYTYKYALQYLTQFLPTKSVEALSIEDIQVALGKLESARLPEASIRTYKVGWRSFFRFANEKGLCSAELFQCIKIGTDNIKKSQQIVLDPRRDVVIKKEPDPRNRLILVLALMLDCTISEIIALMPYNIDFAKQSLMVGKTSSRKRVIDLHRLKQTWDDLTDLAQQVNFDQCLFQDDKGPLTPPQVSQIIDQALQRAGIPATASEVCANPRARKREYWLL